VRKLSTVLIRSIVTVIKSREKAFIVCGVGKQVGGGDERLDKCGIMCYTVLYETLQNLARG
jgi:hypothetical protein